MTGKQQRYLADFQDFQWWPVSFGGSKRLYTGKGKLKTWVEFSIVRCKLVKELSTFNLFSVHKCVGKKNKSLLLTLMNGSTRESQTMPELYNKMELLSEKKNIPLIEVQETMLADSIFTPTHFLGSRKRTKHWLFDLDNLTDSMNYHSTVSSETIKLTFMSMSTMTLTKVQSAEQGLIDDLQRLQSTEKEANEEAGSSQQRAIFETPTQERFQSSWKEKSWVDAMQEELFHYNLNSKEDSCKSLEHLLGRLIVIRYTTLTTQPASYLDQYPGESLQSVDLKSSLLWLHHELQEQYKHESYLVQVYVLIDINLWMSTKSCLSWCDNEFDGYSKKRPDIMFASVLCSRTEKSTTGGSQMSLAKDSYSLGKCKKATIVATSTTEAKYVAAASAVANCYGFKQSKQLTMGSTSKHKDLH
ncbi:hypothetical protein Tco_0698916 [Tanacetum coccineum]